MRKYIWRRLSIWSTSTKLTSKTVTRRSGNASSYSWAVINSMRSSIRLLGFKLMYTLHHLEHTEGYLELHAGNHHRQPLLATERRSIILPADGWQNIWRIYQTAIFKRLNRKNNRPLHEPSICLVWSADRVPQSGPKHLQLSGRDRRSHKKFDRNLPKKNLTLIQRTNPKARVNWGNNKLRRWLRLRILWIVYRNINISGLRRTLG